MMMWHVKTWKFCKLKNSKYFYGKKFWQWRWENIELQRQWRHHLTFKIYIFFIVDSSFSLSFFGRFGNPIMRGFGRLLSTIWQWQLCWLFWRKNLLTLESLWEKPGGDSFVMIGSILWLSSLFAGEN